jgi:hypothetical protein
VGWIESEVQAWLAQRIEESRSHVKRSASPASRSSRI